MDQCPVIQDLLPLYHDDVCSKESRELVKKHLENCDICRRMEKELENNQSILSISAEAE
ncbi:MAG: zf-HC2 domain-containing protein, partial [Lachnospiraceae bacterium]|nr:zf-HC2 domain-containing protein [Lachnospiraceae bacterium]